MKAWSLWSLARRVLAVERRQMVLTARHVARASPLKAVRPRGSQLGKRDHEMHVTWAPS
jgi:hypothetical protein